VKSGDEVKLGMRIRVTQLGNRTGMFVNKKHLSNREVGKTGRVLRRVPGHDNEVWAISQDNGIACYLFDEFERIDD